MAGITACTQWLPSVNAEPRFQPRAEYGPDQVVEYLAAADKALARDHLDDPVRNSALELYRNALILDSDNAHARQGIALVVRRYIALSNAALSKGQFEYATALLTRANAIDPANSVIIHLRQSLAQQEQLVLAGGMPKIIALDIDALAKRDQGLVTLLHQLAEELAISGERLVIYARTDTDVRWIYQQLKQARPEHHFIVTSGLSARPRIVSVPVPPEA